MSTIVNILSLDNPVFKAYLFYSGVLVVKLMSMSLLTGRQRFRKKVFSNPEDAAADPKAKVKLDDPDVERVRRAHLNDLENIPIYFVASFGYMLTNPEPALAINLMRAFTAARIAHTLVYAVVVVPQPSRALAFMVGYGVTGFMAFKTLMAFW
ncbi:hypothetical protein O3M35_009115 [Rhynocoris fuscipes]|uniref:Microsomal glutathione S-transferase 1 n=1 Tax=Rhynocoris fuscipes TaxID=488301 RepID=A0AAW1D1S9_9HEMI